VGHSRFDFLLERNGRPFYLEVKSCTLVGRSIAMFPDAVTARGRRHLEELADMGRRGTPCGVLFLIHWPRAVTSSHTLRLNSPDFAAVGGIGDQGRALGWRGLACPDLGSGIPGP
jgi:DNA-binding sugar fermentation-stimulating protein